MRYYCGKCGSRIRVKESPTTSEACSVEECYFCEQTNKAIKLDDKDRLIHKLKTMAKEKMNESNNTTQLSAGYIAGLLHAASITETLLTRE